MTFIERDLIKKAGADSGWSIVESETSDAIVLGSSSHEQQATIRCFDHEIDVEFTATVNEDELRVNGAFNVIGRVVVVYEREYNSLRTLLRRVQELFVAMPPTPVDLYNARWHAIVDAGLAATETVEMVKQRVGQDVYRETLEHYWKNACAVTGSKVSEVLRASHAKPWAMCETAEERLNVYNGFLLNANLDALFDKGLITFDDEGKIVLSCKLSEQDAKRIGIYADMKLRWIDEHHKPFLKYHRENIWKG